MKKFLISIIVIFFYGCGYSSLYEDQKKDLLINVKNMKGDFEINNFIKNELKIASDKTSTNIYDLNFETKYEKIILTKDATGKATDYKLKMNVLGLTKFWSPFLSKELAKEELIIDLLPEIHRKAYEHKNIKKIS